MNQTTPPTHSIRPHSPSCFLALSAGLSLSAGATIIYEENFDSLTAGSPLSGQDGYSGSGIDIVDQGDGDFNAAGPVGTAAWVGCTRPLGTTITTGWLWTTYTLEVQSSDPRRGGAVALVNGADVSLDGNWAQNHVSYSALNQWLLRAVPRNAFNTQIDVIAPGTVIGAVNLDDGIAYMWVNPDETDFFDPVDGGTADATLSDSKFEGPFDHIFITGRNDITSSPAYDDIIVATTSAEVGLVTVGVPSNTTPKITSISAIGDGIWELTLEGRSRTAYEFRSSPTLEFAPGTLVENLTQDDPGSTGTIEGPNDAALVTDSEGRGTVRINLTGSPADFVIGLETIVKDVAE